MTGGLRDWNPETYARFRGLPPALGLLAQAGEVPKGDIVDLGCGSGAVVGALAVRFSGRRIAGVDRSAAALAVQMSRHYAAPSHRDIAAARFPGRFDFSDGIEPVWSAAWYGTPFARLGEMNAWETQYVQRLESADDEHPVRRFIESAAMRWFRERLSDAEVQAFIAEYDEALRAAYPVPSDGSVILPFLRVFFTVRV